MERETSRLILREPGERDIDNIVENLNNPQVSRFLCGVPYPYTKKDALEDIERISNEWKKSGEQNDYFFIIELKGKNKVIGGLGLCTIDNCSAREGTRTISYHLGENYWGKGYGSEALGSLLNFSFDELGLRRVEASVVSSHEASIKLLRKHGFLLEGTRREGFLCRANGKIHDECIYGLLKEEWK